MFLQHQHDAHLHLEAQCFTPTNAPTAVGRNDDCWDRSGVIVAVYSPVDAIGEGVATFVEQIGGRLFALASLNTTGDDWDAVKNDELDLTNKPRKGWFRGVQVGPAPYPNVDQLNDHERYHPNRQ
jgi:hypothetical protein